MEGSRGTPHQACVLTDAPRGFGLHDQWANIKPMPGRKRRPPFSAFLYRYRNLVERFFSKLKHFRAVATRFEKHSENYLALVKLASAKIWMRFTSW
jgi:transposase